MFIFLGERFVTFVNPFYKKIKKSPNIKTFHCYFLKCNALMQSSCFNYDLCVLL